MTTLAIIHTSPATIEPLMTQASMARVLPGLSAELQNKFLSSPRLGMERVRVVLGL
jgi:hypothetical protein